MYKGQLLLRAFTPSDAPALYAYASDPRVGPMAGWKPHESVEESARIIEHFIRTDEVWAIVEQETGALIGSIGLHSSQKEGVHYDAELGYVLAAPYWGRGLMAEAAGRVMQAAFEELGMQSLCEMCIRDRHDSIRSDEVKLRPAAGICSHVRAFDIEKLTNQHGS